MKEISSRNFSASEGAHPLRHSPVRGSAQKCRFPQIKFWKVFNACPPTTEGQATPLHVIIIWNKKIRPYASSISGENNRFLFDYVVCFGLLLKYIKMIDFLIKRIFNPFNGILVTLLRVNVKHVSFITRLLLIVSNYLYTQICKERKFQRSNMNLKFKKVIICVKYFWRYAPIISFNSICYPLKPITKEECGSAKKVART